VPNVTRALSLLVDYSRMPAGVLERARQEGVAIHKTIELYVNDDLDEDGLPEWLVPRLAAYKKFVADTGFVAISSEQRVYHQAFGYAGQLDLDGTLRVRQGRTEKAVAAVVDVKRSFFAGRAIGLQTAAYAAALEQSARGKAITRRRYALQLRAEGTYRLEPFDDPSDLTNFLACLTVHRLKESMNV